MRIEIRRGSGEGSARAIPTEVVREYAASRGAGTDAPLCVAPEVNLNFFADGSVAACCLGRSFPLGTYPEQTIEDIWRGAAAEALRSVVRSGTLPAGCNICADQLLAGSYAGVMAANYDRHAGDAAAAAAPVLRVLELELSNECNLECEMCNGWNSSLIRRNREGLPPIPELYGAEFVEQLRPIVPGLREARFLGGEPFLIPVYHDIWKLLVDVNPTISTTITTNGTVMNRRVRWVLEALCPSIVISIDSVDPDVYGRVRRNASLDQTLANLELFRSATAASGSSLSISACPTVLTWRTLPGLVEFCNERNLPVVFNTVLQPTTSTLRSLGPDGLRRVHDEVCSAADTLAVVWADEPIAASNVERLRSVGVLAAHWAQGADDRSAAIAEQSVIDELERWAGRPAVLAELDEHLVLEVLAPEWAAWLDPRSWVGRSELDLLPSICAAVGTDDVDIEMTELSDGVVQVDMRFGGSAPQHLRIVRLAHLARDRSRRGLAIAIAP